MNNASLTGRITRDPEINYTQNQIPFVIFTLAVDRDYKDKDGKIPVDFISCVAWNSQAEFISKYVKKGNLLELTGSIQTRSYQNQQGENRVITEVVLDTVKNMTPKPKEEIPAPQEPSYYKPANEETNKNNVDNEGLPF